MLGSFERHFSKAKTGNGFEGKATERLLILGTWRSVIPRSGLYRVVDRLVPEHLTTALTPS